MKLPAEVEAVIERLVTEYGFRDPRTAGTPNVDLVWRSLKLQRDIYEHTAGRKRAIVGATAIATRLPALAAKAIDAAEVLEVELVRLELQSAIDVELEQARLLAQVRAAALARYDDLEGKAIRDAAGPWGLLKREAFCDLIEAGGGGTADGQPFNGDPLAADEASFARAEAVARGHVEPTPTEAVALERFLDAPRP